MLDWKTLAETAAIGTPFSNVVIRGAVEWLKTLKDNQGNQLIRGNALTVSSLVSGMIFGGAFMFFTNKPPLDGDWYIIAGYAGGLVVYGLVQGFIACKIYDSEVAAAAKAK